MRRIDTNATGEKIRQLRKEAGLTVATLQQILCFETPQSIYRWQKGDTVPSVDQLVVLAETFGVRIDDIVVRN